MQAIHTLQKTEYANTLFYRPLMVQNIIQAFAVFQQTRPTRAPLKRLPYVGLKVLFPRTGLGAIQQRQVKRGHNFRLGTRGG